MDNNLSESKSAGHGERGSDRKVPPAATEQLEQLLGPDQLKQLLRVVVEVGSDLDLDVTLHRIVTAAMELTGARYGALAIRGPQGVLGSFICEGIKFNAARGFADLPVGEGVRIDDLTAYAEGTGPGANDLPGGALVGMPISLRRAAFGNLYLGDDGPARTFSNSDETVAKVLASAAAVAIDNARLFEQEHASARWIRASREIMAALLSGEPQTQPLQVIVDRALELAEAEQAILLVPTDADLPAEDVDTLVVAATAGRYTAQVIGQQVPVGGSTTGSVARSGTPVITNSFKYPIEGFTDAGERSAVVMPLRVDDAVLGVIAVARNEQQPAFQEDYLELVSDFATHAAIALALTAGREHARELAILADRERIAHDLHDHVIQKLFAAGLDLQGTITRAHSPEIVNRLARTVDDLQLTIEDIRAAIFGLQSPVGENEDFRQRVQNRIAELTEDRDIATTLEISGSLTAITGELADHADAVITEAVSNAIRHAQCTRLFVRICVDQRLTIDVIDDGCGISEDNQRRSGLANMARRASQVVGKCSVTAGPDGGTRVAWTAPLG